MATSASAGSDHAPKDAACAYQALAEVQGTLRRWSEEGPPSMFRATVGHLAEKLKDSAVDIRIAAEQVKVKDVQVLGLQCQQDTGHCAGRVEVFARVRPFTRREEGSKLCIDADDNNSVLRVRNDGDVVESVLRGQAVDVAVNSAELRDFSFDGVFPTDASQRDIFTRVGLPVLRECFKGFNGTILAYGQTGSGKTFSLLHQGEHAEDAGLLPRLVTTLYVHVAQDVAHAYQVEAAAMQIYNEQIDDLLHRDYSSGGGHNLNVQGAGDVPGLSWLKCKCPDELLEAFARARANVIYAETKMNKASSRSHAVFQIKITKRPHIGGTTGSSNRLQRLECTHAKLNIVDLAGSERVKKSGVEGAHLKEALAINKSLFAFGNVVSALADKRPYVPFRDSKLTRVLEGTIGGNCKTSLLVCTSPASDNVCETVNALEFGSRAMRVEVDARVNASTIEVDANTLVDDLKTSFQDLGFSLGPELDAVRRASCEALQRAQEEVQLRQRAAEEADKKTQSLIGDAELLRKSCESAHGEIERLRETEKTHLSDLEAQRKSNQEACAKIEEHRKKIERLESQIAAAKTTGGIDLAREVSILKAKIVENESKEKTLREELAAVREAMKNESSLKVADVEKDKLHKAEVEQLKKERDEAFKAANEAKNKATTKNRRSDEDDLLIQRLRREVSQLADQLKVAKASSDDGANGGKQPQVQETPRSLRVRTPTPPARYRPNTPHPSRNASQTCLKPPVADSSNSGRMPLSDLTNSIMKDINDKENLKDKAELGTFVATSPSKSPAKANGFASPTGYRSPPKAFERTEDPADMAAGGPSHSPSPKLSPFSTQTSRSLPSSFLGAREFTTKIFEERPRYNTYGGVTVRSALKANLSCTNTDEALKNRRVHFVDDVPVPYSPPKWYLDHLAVLRNPTTPGANQRYIQNTENARSPQSDYSPTPQRAGGDKMRQDYSTTPQHARQFTPPPRKLRAGQGDASNPPRWRG